MHVAARPFEPAVTWSGSAPAFADTLAGRASLRPTRRQSGSGKRTAIAVSIALHLLAGAALLFAPATRMTDAPPVPFEVELLQTPAPALPPMQTVQPAAPALAAPVPPPQAVTPPPQAVPGEPGAQASPLAPPPPADRADLPETTPPPAANATEQPIPPAATSTAMPDAPVIASPPLVPVVPGPAAKPQPALPVLKTTEPRRVPEPRRLPEPGRAPSREVAKSSATPSPVASPVTSPARETPAAAPPAVAPPPAAPLVPPRPIAGMSSNRAPAYPDAALRRGVEGRVVLRVEVSADGAPGSVAVEHGSGTESLDNAALAAVRLWRFVPASRGGIAIAGIAEVPVDFRIAR